VHEYNEDNYYSLTAVVETCSGIQGIRCARYNALSDKPIGHYSPSYLNSRTQL